MSRQTPDAPATRPLAYMQLIFGMAVFGSATPVSKLVADAAPVFVGSALRVGIGALALSPILWLRRKEIARISRGDWLRIAVISAFGMFGFSAFMLYGMALTTGVAGAVVMSTAPAVTAAASVAFLGESATVRKVAAIGLAVAGVLVLHLGQAGQDGHAQTPWLGALLVFAAVCCESVYTLLGKRVGETVDPLLVACLAAIIALPFFAPLALWQWPAFDIEAMGAAGWASLVWYGAGTLALGSALWYSGIARTEGVVAAAFMGVMPVSALLLSYLLLGERFELRHLAGFGVVFAGVLLMSWEHARMARRASAD